MGLFDQLFGKKEESRKETGRMTEKNSIYAPVAGKVIPLEQFPDEVFSAGVLGMGFGIWPEEEQVCAPFEGKVIQMSDTKHAIGLKSLDGMELLIHIGVDTVEMQGKGFQTFVNEGDSVVPGQKLVTFSKKEIRKAGYKDAVAVIITNSDDYSAVRLITEGQADGNTLIMKAE